MLAWNFAVVIGIGTACGAIQPPSAAAQPLPAPADDIDGGPEGELLVPPGPTVAAPEDDGRAYLGVTFDPRIAEAAVALSVAPASPAEHAGLRPGDVIESINGERVWSYNDVLTAIRWMNPGDAIDIDVSRRVSVRTRVVLDRSQSPTPQVAGYTPGRVAVPNTTARRSRTTEEQLPMPVNYQGRVREPRPLYRGQRIPTDPRRYDAAAGRRNANDFNRRRTTTDPGFRNRALFPWRRN
jgi:membrane-associated protease RseP (regulator of RpoE activity)